MQYRTLAGERVSVLGFGLMRLPIIDGDGACIDMDKTEEMMRYAIDNGVNYFDTAYVYHGEKSESAAGEILEKNGLRDEINIATKLPTWMVKSEADVERMLDEQLRRLRTDHIDFYLCHALDKNRFDNVIVKYNVLEKLEQAKREGKIRHIGFSFHDDLATFKRILDSYDGWEFCQIQLNYINTDYQAGLEGLSYAANEKGIGVVIMEPLFGGRLAAPPVGVTEALPKGHSNVENALRFLWNRPEVRVTLSGMGSLRQMKENIEFASRSGENVLTAEELEAYAVAKRIYEEMRLVPCTKCAYCMPCPFGVDIPGVYAAYNIMAEKGLMDAKKEYDALEGKADLCKQCGACRKVCPQSIDTPKLMHEIDKMFG